MGCRLCADQCNAIPARSNRIIEQWTSADVLRSCSTYANRRGDDGTRLSPCRENRAPARKVGEWHDRKESRRKKVLPERVGCGIRTRSKWKCPRPRHTEQAPHASVEATISGPCCCGCRVSPLYFASAQHGLFAVAGLGRCSGRACGWDSKKYDLDVCSWEQDQACPM